MSEKLFENYQVFFGDLHNHCHEVGYGYGSVEDALFNARQQLDFTTVTAHASWHDLDTKDPRLEQIVRYSLTGFGRAISGWKALVQACEAWHTPGEFVTFPSFEWHSSRYGDHVVVYQGPGGEVFEAETPEDIRVRLRQYRDKGLPTFMIPHHIGYLRGLRGYDWPSFTEEFTPAVEMISMHGASESDESPFPYLHTMGPLDSCSTIQAGLQAGNRFGVIGSTDHHSAHPGSYGSGRMGVWAESLTRESLWEAIQARRVYALSGDPLSLQFSVNQAVMGVVVPWMEEREISYQIEAGGAVDYVEVLYHNRVIDRYSVFQPVEPKLDGLLKFELELGWGKKNEYVDWEVTLEVAGGKLLDVTPHFRGPDILSPLSQKPDRPLHSEWNWLGENKIRLVTQSWGNPTASTSTTQGVCVHLAGSADTKIKAKLNDKEEEYSVQELAKGSRVGFLGGFVSPAYRFHRVVTDAEYWVENTIIDEQLDGDPGWYTVRVREKNGQWAWSTPIWFEGQV